MLQTSLTQPLRTGGVGVFRCPTKSRALSNASRRIRGAAQQTAGAMAPRYKTLDVTGRVVLITGAACHSPSTCMGSSAPIASRITQVLYISRCCSLCTPTDCSGATTTSQFLLESPALHQCPCLMAFARGWHSTDRRYR